jgi:hypothetical protein
MCSRWVWGIRKQLVCESFYSQQKKQKVLLYFAEDYGCLEPILEDWELSPRLEVLLLLY